MSLTSTESRLANLVADLTTAAREHGAIADRTLDAVRALLSELRTIAGTQPDAEAPWRDAELERPCSSGLPHFSISVIGWVVDDGFGDGEYCDIVAYWPVERRWTITHTSTHDNQADDYPVTVSHWMPLFGKPPERPAASAGFVPRAA